MTLALTNFPCRDARLVAVPRTHQPSLQQRHYCGPLLPLFISIQVSVSGRGLTTLQSCPTPTSLFSPQHLSLSDLQLMCCACCTLSVLQLSVKLQFCLSCSGQMSKSPTVLGTFGHLNKSVIFTSPSPQTMLVAANSQRVRPPLLHPAPPPLAAQPPAEV